MFFFSLYPFCSCVPSPPSEPILVDTSAEQKGRSTMDALLSMFISKVSNSPKSSKAEAPLIQFNDKDSSASTSKAGSPTEANGGVGDAEPTRYRLLCLDGGGIRGIVLVQMLLEIEKLAQTPVHHMFDWVAGTSTGGILALALGAGKTMRQCLCLYLRMKEQAFVGSRPYASDNLENLLKDTLGAFSVMTDITHPKIMVTGVMADRKPVDLHLFRNYTSASDILGIVTPTREFISLHCVSCNILKSFSGFSFRKSSPTAGQARRPIGVASSPCNWSGSIIFSRLRAILGWRSDCQ